MYNKKRMKTGWIASILLILILSGCSGGTVRYINPVANFSYIKKVAVLPFNNLSDDKYAGERVRSALTIELMSRGAFDVVEQGEVSKVIGIIFREAGAEEGKAVQIDKETLKLVGEKLGVQAVLLGSVDEYSGAGFGGNAVVSLSIRMLDTSSGIVLWQAKSTETSRSFFRKFIGIEEIDRSELTRQVVEDVIGTLL